jgi:hypothetical protein
MSMKVIVNHHRNVALLVTQGSKWLHLIRITARGLESEKITEDELTAEWAELVYPLPKACSKFQAIASGLGATETAARLLTKACDEVADSILESLEV